MTRLLRSSRGFSLLECLIATGALASACTWLLAVCVRAGEQITAARQQSAAAVLARAWLDHFIADVDAGVSDDAGDAHLDLAGSLTRAPGAYRLIWRVGPDPDTPDALQLLVRVEPRGTMRSAADGTTLVALRRRAVR